MESGQLREQKRSADIWWIRTVETTMEWDGGQFQEGKERSGISRMESRQHLMEKEINGKNIRNLYDQGP